MNKNYEPKPIDTNNVVLPAELDELVEKLARNVHDVWAKSRIDEGWTYGEQRNDTLKQHPCLVDYDELPESEKEYDRNTAIGTLKLITHLGFKISK
ncbi:MAG: Ryanodine receptor Ryr [Muribaculaceae bacterium]|nr:Ryanodine receptor Ryr [Muribaculaceae bacterium]